MKKCKFAQFTLGQGFREVVDVLYVKESNCVKVAPHPTFSCKASTDLFYVSQQKDSAKDLDVLQVMNLSIWRMRYAGGQGSSRQKFFDLFVR